MHKTVGVKTILFEQYAKIKLKNAQLSIAFVLSLGGALCQFYVTIVIFRFDMWCVCFSKLTCISTKNSLDMLKRCVSSPLHEDSANKLKY